MPHLLVDDDRREMSLLPEGPLPIRPPYTNGLKVLWRGGDGRGMRNAAPGTSSLFRYAASQVAELAGTPLGLGHVITASAGFEPLYSATTTDAAAGTILVAYRPTTVDGTGRGICEWTGVTTPHHTAPRLLLQQNGSTLRLYWGGAYQIDVTSFLVVGQTYSIVIRWAGGFVALYCNGRRIGTASVSALHSANRIWWGSGFSTNTLAVFPIGGWWESDIGEPAALTLSANPADLFDPESFQIYWPDSGGGAPTTYYHSLYGSLTFSGGVLKRTSRLLQASSTPSGSLTTQSVLRQLLAGSLTPSGALLKLTRRTVAGSITAAATLTRVTRKGLSGAISAVGDLARKTSKAFSGAITAAGSLATAAVTRQSISGAITAVGSLIGTFLAYVVPANIVNRISHMRRFMGRR